MPRAVCTFCVAQLFKHVPFVCLMRAFCHYTSALALLIFLAVTPVFSQHTYRAVVQDAHERTPLLGVNVSLEGTTVGAATDAEGRVVLADIPAGTQRLVFSFIGFETVYRTVVFPRTNPDTVDLVLLEEAESELEEVAITATRTSRTIADLPSRVETIAGEEIDEKISMEPSNLTMLLNESPGIAVQQTSAVSGSASIRIQGLDGRYTQMLKDGFPLFGGFSGGLALLQVPPLDLAQIEIIKGPASTLYGGDAIAGLVNLVSKTPTRDPKLSLLANATSAGGFDLGGFYTARGDHLGITVLASGNLQRAYDPDDDNFSNLPESQRLTINPRLFYYPSEQTTASLGLSGIFETREGGDMDIIADGPGPSDNKIFINKNVSSRFTTQARLDHALTAQNHLTVKNSVSLFNRELSDLIIPSAFQFDGHQVATYTEASVLLRRETHDLVLGLDLRSDAFREHDIAQDDARDYTYTSLGAFVQDTWDVTERMVVEGGLRAEHHNTFGTFVLPRASLLYRLTNNLSTRVGGGLGYKAPTIFLDVSEERGFRNVQPLANAIDAETSEGGSIDINYRTLLFNQVSLAFNQAFYFTNLRDPLTPIVDNATDVLRFVNANGTIRTRALETNAKFGWRDFKLFLGYVYLDAQTDTDDRQAPLPLTPEHKTYTVLVYEQHGKGRVGLEAYYTGPQDLTDGTRTDGYWVTGVMVERRFGAARLFLNFENFLDTKQSNYAPVVSGPRLMPRFAEIWAPMDGFIINGGVKYTL